MGATEGISRIALQSGAAREWPIRQALAASIFIAIGLGVFLVVRRLSGALDVALAPLYLAAAAVLLLAWALAVRVVVRQLWVAWLIAGALLLFAVACSFPGERAVDWLVWLGVFGVF